MKQTTTTFKEKIYFAPAIESIVMKLEQSVLTGSQEGNNSVPDLLDEIW